MLERKHFFHILYQYQKIKIKNKSITKKQEWLYFCHIIWNYVLSFTHKIKIWMNVTSVILLTIFYILW